MGKSASGKDTIYKSLLKKLPLGTIVPYTTRPIREGEKNGVEYYFVERERFLQMQSAGKVIEARTYQTVHGPWTYFTADDGQIRLQESDYLVIGTLESFVKMQEYFGKEKVVPLFLEVEDGVRLTRALEREKAQPAPRYAEMCRRFLADEQDFSEENIRRAGIGRRFSCEDKEQCLQELITYINHHM